MSLRRAGQGRVTGGEARPLGGRPWASKGGGQPLARGRPSWTGCFADSVGGGPVTQGRRGHSAARPGSRSPPARGRLCDLPRHSVPPPAVPAPTCQAPAQCRPPQGLGETAVAEPRRASGTGHVGSTPGPTVTGLECATSLSCLAMFLTPEPNAVGALRAHPSLPHCCDAHIRESAALVASPDVSVTHVAQAQALWSASGSSRAEHVTKAAVMV